MHLKTLNGLYTLHIFTYAFYAHLHVDSLALYVIPKLFLVSSALFTP
jgi:hypothetical protein